MTTIIKDNILNQSTAVRTPVLPEVLNKISNICPSFDDVYPYKTNIKEWLKPVVDLSDFYVYPINGITEGLNWWYNREQRGVWLKQGDYQWIDIKEGNHYIKYQSIPSAIDGNFVDLYKGPLALDLAYIGSTKVRKIELHNEVEYVFYSLSKPFGVRNIRTGWLFTRQRDTKLTALISAAKYYNYYAQNVAETIINNFDIDYVYNKLHKYQKLICHQYDLTASDAVWLATTTDPIYNKFKRGDINRVCIAEEISTAYSQEL